MPWLQVADMAEAAPAEGGGEMTNEQLYVLIGVPIIVNIIFNGVLIGVIANVLSTRMSSLESRMLNLENTVMARFDLMMGRLTELERRP
jgi:hypothetical protein